MLDTAATTHRLSPLFSALLALAALTALPGAAADDAALAEAIQKGERMIRTMQWDKAEDHFYELTEEHPDSDEAWRKLGYVELRRPGGDPVRARQYLEKADELGGDDPIGLFLLGRAYQADGKPEKAAETFERLIELGPGRNDPTRANAVHLARFSRAYLALETGDLDTALPLFETVLEREPGHGYVFYEEGFLELERGNVEAAIENFRKAYDPPHNWYVVETWPYDQGRYAYLKENAAYELGKLLVKTEQYEEAAKLLEPYIVTVERRSEARKRAVAPPPRPPLQTETDARFENIPFYYAKALVGLEKTEEAADMFRAFSRMNVGDDDLRKKARKLYREYR